MGTNYQDIITIEPAWLDDGMRQAEIIEDFPELNANYINACLCYEKSSNFIK